MPFTGEDVDRVQASLEQNLWVGSTTDTRTLALRILDTMTSDGWAAEDVSAVRFRVKYGIDALLAAVDACTPADDEDEDGVDDVEVGDLLDDETGLGVMTPYGRWCLTDEDALGLVAGIGSLLQSRPARSRELRRDIDQTTELGTIADYYA